MDRPEVAWWRKIINWFCGTEQMQDSREPVFTIEEADANMKEAERQLSIEESPKGRLLTSIGMVAALSITVFICGFFA